MEVSREKMTENEKEGEERCREVKRRGPEREREREKEVRGEGWR